MAGKRLKIRAKDLVDMLILKNHASFMEKYNLTRAELMKLKTSLTAGSWEV